MMPGHKRKKCPDSGHFSRIPAVKKQDSVKFQDSCSAAEGRYMKQVVLFHFLVQGVSAYTQRFSRFRNIIFKMPDGFQDIVFLVFLEAEYLVVFSFGYTAYRSGNGKCIRSM